MTEPQSTSNMIRSVAENNHNFLNAIADHIDRLEARIEELEQPPILEDECNDENT